MDILCEVGTSATFQVGLWDACIWQPEPRSVGRDGVPLKCHNWRGHRKAPNLTHPATSSKTATLTSFKGPPNDATILSAPALAECAPSLNFGLELSSILPRSGQLPPDPGSCELFQWRPSQSTTRWPPAPRCPSAPERKARCRGMPADRPLMI